MFFAPHSLETRPNLSTGRKKKDALPEPSPTPAPIVEYGFEELSRMPLPETKDVAPSAFTASPEKTRSKRRTPVPRQNSSDAATQDVPPSEPTQVNKRTTREGAEIPVPHNEYLLTVPEVLRTSMDRVLGNHLDLTIAVQLLRRALADAPDRYDHLRDEVIERIEREITYTRAAEADGISMPFSVAQLEQARDFLAQDLLKEES